MSEDTKGTQAARRLRRGGLRYSYRVIKARGEQTIAIGDGTLARPPLSWRRLKRVLRREYGK